MPKLIVFRRIIILHHNLMVRTDRKHSQPKLVTHCKKAHQRFLKCDSSFCFCVLVNRLSFSSSTLSVFTKQHGAPVSFLSRNTAGQCPTDYQWQQCTYNYRVPISTEHIRTCRQNSRFQANLVSRLCLHFFPANSVHLLGRIDQKFSYPHNKSL